MKPHLTACIFLFCSACVADYELNPIKIGDIISFDSPAQIAIKADGKSTVTFNVTVKSDNEESVTFSTDRGSFTNTSGSSNSKIASITTIQRKASITLTSDLVPMDSIRIQASVSKNSKTYIAKKTVTFSNAKPTDFFLTSDKNKVKADLSAFATISINITRGDNNGRVSSGITFTISPTIKSGDTLDVDVVPFIKTKEDSNETPLTFTIKSKNDYPGTVTLMVKTTDDNGNEIIRTKDIIFAR
jgi:hypothetical protein